MNVTAGDLMVLFWAGFFIGFWVCALVVAIPVVKRLMKAWLDWRTHGEPH